jgi:hypothetical protein
MQVNFAFLKFIKRKLNHLSSKIIKELCAASFYGSLGLKKSHKKRFTERTIY